MMKLRAYFLFVLLICSCSAVRSQVGIQPLGTYTAKPDNINIGNLSVHYDIPLFSRHERGSGTDVLVHLIYDGGPLIGHYKNLDIHSAGWRLMVGTSSAYSGHVTQTVTDWDCGPNTISGNLQYFSYSVVDQTGYTHYFPYQQTWTSCDQSYNQLTGPSYASDGSGYALIKAFQKSYTVATPSGVQLNCVDTSGTDDCTAVDTNGNSTHAFYLGNVGTLSFSDPASSYLGVTGAVPSNSSGTSDVVTYKDTSGTIQHVSLTFGSYLLRAASDNGNDVSVHYPSAINFPDGSSYQFQYEASPYDSGYYTGRLSSVTLPTGGTISYTYSDVFTPGCGISGYYVSGISRVTSDGATQYASTKSFASADCFLNGGTSTTTVTEAAARSSIYSFVFGYDSVVESYTLETSHQIFNGGSLSGTPVEATARCYNGNTTNCVTASVQHPITQIDETTTKDGIATSRVVQVLNTVSLPTEVDEYDYGASAPTKKTITQYASLGNYILDRISSITVTNGSNQTVGQVSYGYDESSLTGTSSLPSHSTVSGARGNRTSQHVWLNTTGGTLDTSWEYDDAGQVRRQIDGRGNGTKFDYDTATDSCLWTRTYPYTPSGATSPLKESATCNAYTGAKETATDMNGTVTNYTYDSMLRSSGSTKRDTSNTLKAQITTAYAYSGGREIVTTVTSADPSPSMTTTKTLDGYGRIYSESQPGGTVVDTRYDALGRVHTVSNPYLSASDSTYGITTYGYDALDRQTSVLRPDNVSSTSTTYTGKTVTSSDEAGNSYDRDYDVWGHVTRVQEPGSLLTNYTYDLSGNLTAVNQSGLTRSFFYDSASRLIASYNPEAGNNQTCSGASGSTWSLCYSYDGNGNLLSKTDARAVTSSYTYDPMNRVTVKKSSGGVAATRSSCYIYDTSGGITNALGHLIGEWTQVADCPSTPTSIPSSGVIASKSITSFDTLGRPLTEVRCTWGNCNVSTPQQYGYDLAGALTSYNDGRGVYSFLQSFDSAGRLQVLKRSAGGIQTPVLNILSYSPAGWDDATLGSVISEKRTYDNRMRVQSEIVRKP